MVKKTKFNRNVSAMWATGIFLVLLMLQIFCTSTGNREFPPNTLSAAEKAAGWKLLFDGETFTGWRGIGRKTVPRDQWVIENGMIKNRNREDVSRQADGRPPQGGDLMTVATFENFELKFDWKISPGGNSGVKYNVSEKLSASRGSPYSALGFEYQVIDDVNFKEPLTPLQQTGALYDLVPPQDKLLKPVGQFNRSRIVFTGNHGEHRLNGKKLLEFELGSAKMDSAMAAGKFRDIPGFAAKKKGHIVLQDHGDEVFYRNIKILVTIQVKIR